MTRMPRAGRRSAFAPGPGPLLPFLGAEVPARYLVLHLPDLACELAIFERESRVGVAEALGLGRPLAAVLLEDPRNLSSATPVHSATAAARRAGVRPGQAVADALRLVPDLDVRGVSSLALERALRGFSEIVSDTSQQQRLIAPDSLSLGFSSQLDDEGPTLAALCERLQRLGHRVRAAVADREAAALLLARFGPDPRCVVPPGQEMAVLAHFPPEALLRTERALFHHPSEQVTLGATVEEEVRWPAPASGAEPLRNALYWLAARATARLAGRHQEAHGARLELLRSDAAPRRIPVALAQPIRKPADLIQPLAPRLDELASTEAFDAVRLVLEGLRSALEEAPSSGGTASLQALVAELGAELGPGRLGLLSAEEGSSLPRLHEPPSPQINLWPAEALTPPTRVLDVPVPVLGKLARGARVEIDQQVFVVQRVTPVEETRPQAGLDHLVVWLSHGDSGALSWISRDRRLKRALLHGWFT